MQFHVGRTFVRQAGSPFIAATYNFDAPIDEFGMQWLASLTAWFPFGCYLEIFVAE